MGPVALIIIALGSVIAASASQGQTTSGITNINASTVTSSDSGLRLLIGLIIFAGSLFVAATLPLKWGGDVMKTVTGKSKKLMGWAGKTTGASGAASLIGNKFKTSSVNNQALRANKLASFISGGKVGTSSDILKGQQRDAAVTEAGKQIGVAASNDATLAARYNKANKYEKIAIEREMAGRGSFEKLSATQHIDPTTGTFYDAKSDHWGIGLDDNAKKGNKEAAERLAKVDAGAKLASLGGSDTALEKAVKDNQGEIMVAAAEKGGQYGASMKSGFLAGQAGKPGSQKRTQTLEFLDGEEAKKFLNGNDVKQIMGRDGDGKKQGHIAKFIERGAASPEAKAAYDEIVSSQSQGQARSSDGLPSLAERKAAIEEQQNVHRNL